MKNTYKTTEDFSVLNSFCYKNHYSKVLHPVQS